MQISQDTCSTAGPVSPSSNPRPNEGEASVQELKEREECHLLVRPPYWHDQGVCMTSSRTEGALLVASCVHKIDIDFYH